LIASQNLALKNKLWYGDYRNQGAMNVKSYKKEGEQ
jgi:hypothetical protein